jgi:uncharacterized membrane protein AbrB (regulator of aidB expression)
VGAGVWPINTMFVMIVSWMDLIVSTNPGNLSMVLSMTAPFNLDDSLVVSNDFASDKDIPKKGNRSICL